MPYPLGQDSFPSSTPSPNRAKSPFSGSSGNILSMVSVSRRAVVIDAVRLCSRFMRCASCTTCVSSGMIRLRRSMMSAHRPRSTGEFVRTIHRRNIHTRLQADDVFLGTILLAPWTEKKRQMASTASNPVDAFLLTYSFMLPYSVSIV